MGIKLLKIVEIDDEKGSLYCGGKRVLLITVNFLYLISFYFNKIFEKEGERILNYRLGMLFGEGYVEYLKSILEKEKVETSKETILSMAFTGLTMESGWGKIETIKDSENKITGIKIFNPPSMEVIPDPDFCFEAGVLTGVYQAITKENVYFFPKEKDKEPNCVFFVLQKNPPEGIQKEKEILKSYKEIEKEIKEKTIELQKKIEELEEAKEREMVLRIRERAKTREIEKKMEELEKFQRLTVGRELKIVELKKQIKKLEEELRKYQK